MKSKIIENFPEYTIYEDGRIFSSKTNAFLKPYANKQGYCTIILYKEGVRNRWLVHRLVAEHFIGKAPRGMMVNHINHNPEDNHVSNLEWVTNQENQFASLNHPNGRRFYKEFKYVYKGQVITVVNLPEFCKEHGLHNGHMSHVHSGKRKSHKGYTRYN